MSTIRVDNFGPSAGGTTYSARGIAKAWVNFDGTGTIAARDSENVSSLTDNGTGVYTVNIGNAFAAGDYSISGCVRQTGQGGESVTSDAEAASSVAVITSYYSTAYDPTTVGVTIHGDLA